jgi:ubiquinone/menaquinone biosynthesis C-methylase UbiE
VVDLSCGSGLFTRKFLACGHFPNVMALDFSESMLQQTKELIEQDRALAQYAEKVTLVRADVNRLPLKSGSVAAIHAGALC